MLASIKNWLKSIITILLIQFFNIPIYAQEQNLLAEVEFKTGLQSNNVRCLAIDIEKRVWVGTDNGLNILNAESAEQKAIIQLTGDVSIWAINFLDSLVFIGSRLDGLFVYNHTTGKLIAHHSIDEITLIRKIKVFNNQVFVLSNNGMFVWRRNKLSKLKFTEDFIDDFPTDAFLWNGNIYALVYPTRQVIKLSRGAFEENCTAEFIPPTASAHNSLLCSFVKRDKLVIGGDGFYIIKEKYNKSKVFQLPSSAREQFVVFDIAITESKIVLAIGENLASQKGFVYVHGDKFPKIGSENYGNGFLTCLAWEKDDDRLLYGDLNNGLYLQKFISTTSAIIKSKKTRVFASKGKSFLFDESEIANTSFYKDGVTQNVIPLIKPLKNAIAAIVFGDTLAVAYENNIKIYNSSTFQSLKTIIPEKYTGRGLVSMEILNDKLYLFYNYLNGIYQLDIKTNIVKLISTVQSFLPKTKKIDDKIIFFNSEKGFNTIDINSAFSFLCSDKSIAFAEDFEVVNNDLFVLVKGKLKTFFINYKTRGLIPKGEIGLQNFIEGFEVKWLLSKEDKLYLVNEKGMLQFNPVIKLPENYYYFGNFNQIEKPIVDGDTLFLATNYSLNKIAFKDIDEKYEGVDTDLVTLNYPHSANENLAFVIEIGCKDYQMQNHSIKYVDVKKNGKLVMRNYSINNRFSFPRGLKYGNYDLEFNIGNKKFYEELEITLPLNRNPYFFGAIILFSLVTGLLFVKSKLDKKEFNKQLMQNRLQILKQNLNPHFVFNSMNLISSLILEKKYVKAVEVVSEFSNLQRTYLETNNKESITLTEELGFLKSYLKLQQTRFHLDNDFRYQITVGEDVNTGSILLPPLILQPLAENAIKYGIISSNATDKKIWVDVSGGSPVIVGVEDNGELTESIHKGFGLGHQLVQERIQLFRHTFKTPITLHLKAPLVHSHTGYRVEVHIG